MRTYLATIVERGDTVEYREKNHLGTVAPEDVFSFLDQDVRVVCEEGCVRGSYLVRYVKETAVVILEEFIASMEARVAKGADVDELCAIINDCSRSQKLCGDVLSFVTSNLGSDKDHDTAAVEAFDDVQSSFLRLSVRCVHAMADTILESLTVLLAKYLEASGSAETRAAATIRSTIMDYFDDPDQGIRGWLSDVYFFASFAQSFSIA